MDIFAIPWGAALLGATGGVLAFIALLIIWVVVLWHPRPLVRLLPERPLLLGHRGVRLADGPPENSLAAFRRAFSAGLDGIECDVQQSADGVLVIYHDETLPGGRTIRSVPFKELRDALPELATVDELFGLAKEYPEVLLNLELKVYGRDSGGLEPRLARAIFKAELPTRVLVSSFNPLALARFRLVASGVRVALLTDPDRAWWLQRSVFAGLLHVDALHPHHTQVTPERLAAAHARGLMVNVWTVNDPERQYELARLGADALIADDPATLTKLRSRLEPRATRTDTDKNTDSPADRATPINSTDEQPQTSR